MAVTRKNNVPSEYDSKSNTPTIIVPTSSTAATANLDPQVDKCPVCSVGFDHDFGAVYFVIIGLTQSALVCQMLFSSILVKMTVLYSAVKPVCLILLPILTLLLTHC